MIVSSRENTAQHRRPRKLPIAHRCPLHSHLLVGGRKLRGQFYWRRGGTLSLALNKDTLRGRTRIDGAHGGGDAPWISAARLAIISRNSAECASATAAPTSALRRVSSGETAASRRPSGVR